MKQKFLGMVCLIYAGIILFVNHYNILRNFLAPQMQIYLKASIIPLLIMSLVIFFSDRFHYKFKLIDIFLLLPIALVSGAGDGRLTTNFANNRSSNIISKKNANNSTSNEKEESVVEEEQIEAEVEEKNLDLENIDFDIIDENYLDLANFLTYNSKGLDYAGKTVRVRGFTIDESLALPKGYIAIGKYGVSCCAADANFTGFVVKKDDYDIKSNSWYELEGYFEKIKDLAGYDILSIKIVNIKEIDGNKEEQYVYPCYSYGDGNCSSVLKYNLNYR